MSDSVSGAVGISSAGERNERFSEWRRGQGVEKREKRAIQRVAWRACRPSVKATGDSVSGAAGTPSSRETNERYSERHGGRVVGGRRTERCSKRHRGLDVNKRN
jgi:hypothetical protein